MLTINNDTEFQTLINKEFNHNSGLILKNIEFGSNYELHFRKFNIPNVNNIFAQIRFENCEFKGQAFFSNTIFEYSTTFSNVKFNAIAVFCYSTFKSDIRLINCTFSNVHAGNSHFDSTVVCGKRAEFINNVGLIDFWNIKFSESTTFLLEGNYPKNFGIANAGELAYRIAKLQAYKIGDVNLGDKYYYLERSYRGYQIMPPISIWDKTKKGYKKFVLFNSIKVDKYYKFIFPKTKDLISKYLIGYGEKPFNCIFWMLIFILSYSFIYMFTGLKINNEITYLLYNPNASFIESFQSIFDYVFFSIVTFTTVGYGDITTGNLIGKFFASTEMILGVTLIGAWTATLLRKLMK